MNLRQSAGFTLIELLIVVAIIGIIAATASPGLMRARMSGNESAAIASVRAVVNGQASYSTSCGQGGYATDLTVLGTPCAGGTRGFISADLNPTSPGVMVSGAGVVKSGYDVQLSGDGVAGPNDLSGTPTNTGYLVTAAPLTLGTTGQRGFNSSHSGAIYVDPAGGVAGTIPLQ